MPCSLFKGSLRSALHMSRNDQTNLVLFTNTTASPTAASMPE